MQIYILTADVEMYQAVILSGETVLDTLRLFDGRRIDDGQFPPSRRRLLFPEEEKSKPKGDFPGLANHIPVFGSKAFQELGPLLHGNGQFFRSACNEHACQIFNVTRLIPALDEERSTVWRFRSSGRVKKITEHAFHMDKIRNFCIFKLPQTALMNVYVTDRFKTAVEEAGLNGFSFHLA